MRAVPCLCEFYPGICLITEEKARKTLSQGRETSVRLRKTSVRVQYTYYQNTHTLQNPHKHTHYKTHTNTHYKTHTNTHITKPTQTHTLQNPHKHTYYKTYTNTHITKQILWHEFSLNNNFFQTGLSLDSISFRTNSFDDSWGIFVAKLV